MVCVICRRNQRIIDHSTDDVIKSGKFSNPMYQIFHGVQNFIKIIILDPRGIKDQISIICHKHADIIIKNNTRYTETIKEDQTIKDAERYQKLRDYRWAMCGYCGRKLDTHKWTFVFTSENNNFRLAFSTHPECSQNIEQFFGNIVVDIKQHTLS